MRFGPLSGQSGNRLSVNVSIVTYRTDCAELERCLRSLDSECVERIYIVDNASETAVRDFCRKFPKVEYIPSANGGYGAGHNQALERSLAAGVDYHLVLNSDVEFNPAILGKAVTFMDANADVALVHPRLEYPDGRPQHTARLLPTPLDVFGRRFIPAWLDSRRDRRYTLAFADPARTLDVPYVQGSFMLMRCSALRQSGLFDTRFFMYPEDIDLTRRLHSRFRTLYWPEISAIHSHKAASRSSMRMLRVHIVNMIRYFNKWGWFVDRERSLMNRRLLARLADAGQKP